jgi:hypothetical protein
MLKLSYAALAVALVVSGCATTKEIKFTPTPIERQKIVLPSVDQISQDPIKYYLLVKSAPPGQPGSLEYFWQQLEKSGQLSGIAISASDYKKMQRNNAKVQQLILQQQAIISAYKKYYEANK